LPCSATPPTGPNPRWPANFRAAVETLATLGSVDEIDLPEFPYEAAATVVIQAEAAGRVRGVHRVGAARQLSAPEDRYGLLDGLALPAVDYLRALRIRRLAGRALDTVLSSFDVVVAPTQPGVAPPIDEQFGSYAEGADDATVRSLGAAGNLCGLPAVTVPNGVGKLGLPTGLEFMGRASADGTLLAAAAAFERAWTDSSGGTG
jgi:aspartyl-tRNA(Asn)/glutamyl-tRNA(Gln) amidotransferase subunit A